MLADDQPGCDRDSPAEEGADGHHDEGADGHRYESEPDLTDAMAELAELEELVDSRAEREQVRSTMRTLRAARKRPLIGSLRDAFGLRDAGEALLGSFIVGVPLSVEDGTLSAGAHLAAHPTALAMTVLGGIALVLGILRAVRFAAVDDDLVLGLVPLRLVGIFGIASLTAVLLLTTWGRVDWAEPWVAGSQTTLIGLAMAVGASLGDILPEG